MNYFPDTKIDSLDPKNREQIIVGVGWRDGCSEPTTWGCSAQLMRADFLKRAGWPRCRLMTFPTYIPSRLRGVEKLPRSRRTQLSTGCSDPRLTFIVNLTGSAEIYLHEAEAMKRIWQQIVDNWRAFFLQDPAKGPGFVVIHRRLKA